MDRENHVVAPRPRSGGAPPEDVIQHHLVTLWQQFLPDAPLGIDDDFFELGGNSELCDRMFAACEKLVDAPVCAGDVSGVLSVRNLARVLVSRLEARACAGSAARPVPSGRPQHAPPHDALQDRLADVWERLLGRSAVGIDDDFFALGGTPELAERMFAAVEEHCGARLRESDLATGRITVRAMADALVARVPRARVFHVQAGRPEVPPVFFVHGDFGGGGYYVRELARGLGPEQPVAVLQQHGMHGDDVPASIEAIATDHVATLTSAWPDGPFYLAGLCISAVIAFEMARQLAAQGRQAACALLIDPLFLHDGTRIAALPPPRLSPEARRSPGVRSPWLMAEYLAILEKYQYAPYAGSVAVFWAGGGGRPLDVPGRRALIRSLAPSANMYTCPGSHITAIGRDVARLAATIRDALRHQSA